MVKNILFISISSVDVEKLFNQNRDISHYCYVWLWAFTIEMLIMLCMHTDKNLDISPNNLKEENTYTNDKIYTKINLSLSLELGGIIINKNSIIKVKFLNKESLNVVLKNDKEVVID